MYKLAAGIALCFFVFILWVIYLANTGGSSIFFEFIREIPYGDKIGHAGLFGFLTLILIISLRFRALSIGKLRLYYGFLFVLLFVVGEELSQAFISTRTFDFVDLGADLVGIITAVAICFVGNKHLTESSSKDAASGAA